MESKQQRMKGIYMILLGGAMWGASGISVQFLFEQKYLRPDWLVLQRMLISGIVFLIWSRLGGTDIAAVWRDRGDRWRLLFYSVCGMFFTQYSYFITISLSNAPTATVIQYLMPVIVLLYSLLRYRRRPSASEVGAVMLAVLGTFLIVTRGDFSTLALSPRTLVWGLLSAFAMALYTVYPRGLLIKYSSTCIIGWSMLIGSAFVSIFLKPFPFSGIMDWGTAGGMTVLILFGTIIAFYTYLESTKYINPAEVGALSSVEPLTSVILGVLFMGLRPGLMEAAGMLCIIATVIILARKQ